MYSANAPVRLYNYDNLPIDAQKGQDKDGGSQRGLKGSAGPAGGQDRPQQGAYKGAHKSAMLLLCRIVSRDMLIKLTMEK